VVTADEMPFWTEIREFVGFEVPPNDIIHAQVPNWRQYRESNFARVS